MCLMTTYQCETTSCCVLSTCLSSFLVVARGTWRGPIRPGARAGAPRSFRGGAHADTHIQIHGTGDPSYYSTKYGTGLRFSSCSKRPSYNCVNPRRRCCLGGTKLQRCSARHTLVCADAGPPAELAFHDPRVDERPSKGRRADVLSNTYVLRVMTLDPRYRLSNHHRFRPSCALSRGSRRRWLRRRLPAAGGVVIHRLCSHNVSL